MKLFNLFLLFTALLFTGCAKDEIALDTAIDFENSNNVTTRGQFKPFKGSVTYLGGAEIDLTCECVDGFFIGNFFSGTGNITHMGNVTSESIPCISLIADENGNVFGFNIESQCGFITAANGDLLYFDTAPYVANLDLDCFCQFAGTADVTFAGGTGRFEDAEGSAVVLVVQDAVTGVTTSSFDGEISY